MARSSQKNVGIIGLGIIGRRVAAGLRAAGFPVFVWNRTARPEPNFLASAAAVADVSDVIQLFVADAQAVFDVLDAMGELLGPRHTVICSATIGPEATIDAAKLVRERGAKFLDAPFTGSRAAAEKGALVYYIGGEDEVFLPVAPVLKAVSKAIIRIGAVGQAAAIKIATNMLAAVSVQALAEALAIARRSGVDAETFAAAIEHHAARSGLIDMKLPNMAHGEYEPHFSLKHMFKDVQIGIHIANALEIDVPATTATAGVMYGCLNRDWANLDYSVLARVYEPGAPAAAPVLHEPLPAEKKEAPAGEKPHKETLVSMAPPPRTENAHTPSRQKTKTVPPRVYIPPSNPEATSSATSSGTDTPAATPPIVTPPPPIVTVSMPANTPPADQPAQPDAVQRDETPVTPPAPTEPSENKTPERSSSGGFLRWFSQKKE